MNLPIENKKTVEKVDDSDFNSLLSAKLNRLIELNRKSSNPVLSSTNLRFKFSKGSIESKIKESEKQKKERLENESLEQDIRLKRQTLNYLFFFLVFETAIIFIFTMWQGFTTWGFKLEEWSFKLLVASTISQITAMLFVAVNHLFPRKK